MEECGTCCHWRPQKIQSTPADKTGKGFCCRYPPQISDYQVAKYFAGGLRGCELGVECTWWPATDKADGCGEHKPIEREKRNGGE